MSDAGTKPSLDPIRTYKQLSRWLAQSGSTNTTCENGKER